METPKRSVFHRLGRRTSVFDRLGSCGEISGKRSVFDRIGLPNANQNMGVRVCTFWVQGRCNRNPCRFRHSEDDAVIFKEPDEPKRKRCRYDDVYDDLKPEVKRPKVADSEVKPEKRDLATTDIKKEAGNDAVAELIQKPLNLQDHIEVAKPMEVAKSKPPTENASPATEVASPPAEVAEVMNSKPTEEEKPHTEIAKPPSEVTKEALHCTGSGLSLLGKLKRHNSAVTGVCLPSGSENLYSVSKEGTLCIWDARNGDCLQYVQWGKEIRCFLNEGRWLFVAMEDSVNALNMDTNEHLVLAGFNAPIRCMAAGDVNKLFCGLEDGSVCVWKGSELVATLKGHEQPVLSLCISADGCLFSASEDSSIRVWNLRSFECVCVLNAHSGAVTSLLSWGTYMLSGSLDKTLNVWASSENGSWKLVHQVGTEFGVVGLNCICDALLCSLNDNLVRVISPLSFSERGRVLSDASLTSTAIGGTGLFFTGDDSGLIGVWRLDGQQPSEGAEKL